MPAIVKQILRRAGTDAALARFVSVLERFPLDRSNLLQVLTYHRIDEPTAHPDLAPTTLSATPEAFRQQMQHLALRYCPVSMNQVLEAHRGGAPLPPRAVLITFDDAYRDFAEHAWPILRHFGIPVTLFVPTAFPDHPEMAFWWDRLYRAIDAAEKAALCTLPCGTFELGEHEAKRLAHHQIIGWLKQLPHEAMMQWLEVMEQQLSAPIMHSHVLSWDALRRLAVEGVTLGAHTQTHPLLYRVSPQRALAETVGSFADLRREIGDVPPVFAYPGGKFNVAAVEAVRAAGFELALASRRGVNRIGNWHPLRVRRNYIGKGTTHTVFRLRLLPWSMYLNRWRPVNGR